MVPSFHCEIQPGGVFIIFLSLHLLHFGLKDINVKAPFLESCLYILMDKLLLSPSPPLDRFIAFEPRFWVNYVSVSSLDNWSFLVEISFDIWILEFDIWNWYLGGSKECGRSGVGKSPKVRKLLS